jgi:SAM-dependent methyltransferase
MVEEIFDFLSKNNISKIDSCLDVCCGRGEKTGLFSEMIPKVYGVDNDREELSYGIARGNFKSSIALHGDAYSLTSENQNFSKVYLEPENYKRGRVDWMKLRHEEFKTRLENFDLVTAFNPQPIIRGNKTASKILSSTLGYDKIDCGLIPLNLICYPAKKRGHILYSFEIANLNQRNCFVSGMPNNVSEEYYKHVKSSLDKEGRELHLKSIDSCLRESSEDGMNICTLFEKLR